MQDITAELHAWRMTTVLCSGAFANFMPAENLHKSTYPHILVDDFMQVHDISSELVAWTKTNVEMRCVRPYTVEDLVMTSVLFKCRISNAISWVSQPLA